jgi:hypothetical protein
MSSEPLPPGAAPGDSDPTQLADAVDSLFAAAHADRKRAEAEALARADWDRRRQEAESDNEQVRNLIHTALRHSLALVLAIPRERRADLPIHGECLQSAASQLPADSSPERAAEAIMAAGRAADRGRGPARLDTLPAPGTPDNEHNRPLRFLVELLRLGREGRREEVARHLARLPDCPTLQPFVEWFVGVADALCGHERGREGLSREAPVPLPNGHCTAETEREVYRALGWQWEPVESHPGGSTTSPPANPNPFWRLLAFGHRVFEEEVQTASRLAGKRLSPLEWGPRFREKEDELRTLVASALRAAKRTGFSVEAVESRVEALADAIKKVMLWQRDARHLTDEERRRIEQTGIHFDPAGEYLQPHIQRMMDAWRPVEALAVRADPDPAAPSGPDTKGAPMADSERPSPFTIPEPAYKFVQGPAAQARPAQSMTVGGLIHNLTVFADFYERASAAIDRAEPFEKPRHFGAREAQADMMQRDFRATVAIDRVRDYVLGSYGAELTIGTARRLLGDLVRRCGLTVNAAEGLTLEAAMDRLEADGAPAGGQAEAAPAAATGDEATLALMRVFTNGVADDRIKKAARLLVDSQQSTNNKLSKIDALIPFPATASAEQLGKLLGVSKQAVLKTEWWVQNRKGEKQDEVGRRREGHRQRARRHDVSGTDGDDG